MKLARGSNAIALELALPHLHGHTAADVGSGAGRVLDVLQGQGYTVHGCEMDVALADHAGVDHADAFDWSPPSSVDVVTCIEVIEHVPQARHRELMRRMVSWLNTDGRLVVSTPQRNSPVSVFERAFHRLRPKHGPYCWWDASHVSVMGRRYWEDLFRELDLTIKSRVGCGFAPELAGSVLPPVKRLRSAATDGPLAVLGFDLLWVLGRA